MKKNQLNRDFPAAPVVRFYDIGPKIDFFPLRQPSFTDKIKHQLPAATVLLVTASLVLHWTVGSGATIVPAPGSSSGPDLSPNTMSQQEQSREAWLLTGQAPDFYGSEALSRGLSAQALLEEKVDTAQTIESDETTLQLNLIRQNRTRCRPRLLPHPLPQLHPPLHRHPRPPLPRPLLRPLLRHRHLLRPLLRHRHLRRHP